MTDNAGKIRRALGVIVARRKSTRLPGKVLRPLSAHPLIGYICSAAVRTIQLDRVILSTEDHEIASVAQRYGVEAPFLRPQHLAEDFAADYEILKHAVETVEEIEGRSYDDIVLMQSTTPFVEPATIDACVDLLRSGDFGTVFASRPVSEPPDWMFSMEENGRAKRFKADAITEGQQHTQNLPPLFLPTGAVYACRRKAFMAQESVYASPLGIVVMSPERAIDIDTELDLTFAEAAAEQFGFSIFSSDPSKTPQEIKA